MTTEQVAAIKRRLFEGWEPPLGVDALHKLLQTDRYSDAVELTCATELYGL